MKVADVMTHGTHTCRPQDSLNRAAQLMWDNDCGCVAIVDGDGRAIGMITDRDVCMAAYTQGRALSEIPVSSAASSDVFTVRETDTVGTAEALMRKHKVRRLPVVDLAGRPIGMLSMNDLARYAYKTPHRTDGLSPALVAQTLATICEPPSGQATSVS